MPARGVELSGLAAFYQQIKHRPRLTLSVLLGCALFLLLPANWRAETRALIAWDFAASLYISLFFRLAHSSSPEIIQDRAKAQDDGAVLTLILSLLAAIMCFVAIAFELAGAKSAEGNNKLYHLMLVAGTIPIAWTFIHTMFALHYAHEYYDEDLDGDNGLEFPGNAAPNYWDFIYFSFIIGTSGQTADVSVTSQSLRKLATIHCVLAFFFNITMLGLTINVASSLL